MLTATKIPGSTPTLSTPTVVSRQRLNSKRLSFQKPFSACTSIRPQPASNRTAPSAGIGTQPRGLFSSNRVAAITSAATRPTSWVLPPTMSFTAVRESAPLMAKPWETPAPMLARPRATNSWLALML
ncbi:hypothetical protein X922_32925 [Pseudomonas aeruginosa VRFPA08]|nr:hypothetical protein X922_32925 [Pseudomonas aeruginosa VRFPA08]